MPPRKKQLVLSEEEKQEIIKRRHELVDKMNEKLPSGMKLEYDDEGLNEKLNDPSTVIAYRVGLGATARKIMQDAQLQILKAKYPSNFQTYGFKIERYFKTENTKEAREYNETLYENYIEDPEAFMNKAFTDLVQFNPNELYNCGNDKGKIADYYYRYFEQCENASALSNYISNNPNVVEDVKEKKGNILAITNALKYPVEMCKTIDSTDFLACPDLTKEQAEKFNLDDQLDFSQSVNQKIKDAVEGEELAPSDYYDSIGLGDIIEEGNYQNIALEIEFTKTVQTGNTTSTTTVPFSEFLNNHDKEIQGVEYEVKQNPAPVFEREDFNYSLESINRASQKEFINEFGRRLNEKLGISGPYNPKVIEDKFKGNVFERLGGTTSEEYKALRDAIKDYSDPNSPYYMNYGHMREKAEAYIAHKEDQGYLTAGYLFNNDRDQRIGNGEGPMVHEGNIDPNEENRLRIAAERHQELQYFAQGKKAKDLSGTEFKRFCLAKAVIDMGKEMEEILDETLDQTIYQLGGVNDDENEHIDLFDVYENEMHDDVRPKVEYSESEKQAMADWRAARKDKDHEYKYSDEDEYSIEDDGESMDL